MQANIGPAAAAPPVVSMFTEVRGFIFRKTNLFSIQRNRMSLFLEMEANLASKWANKSIYFR